MINEQMLLAAESESFTSLLLFSYSLFIHTACVVFFFPPLAPHSFGHLMLSLEVSSVSEHRANPNELSTGNFTAE